MLPAVVFIFFRRVRRAGTRSPHELYRCVAHLPWGQLPLLCWLELGIVLVAWASGSPWSSREWFLGFLWSSGVGSYRSLGISWRQACSWEIWPLILTGLGLAISWIEIKGPLISVSLNLCCFLAHCEFLKMIGCSRLSYTHSCRKTRHRRKDRSWSVGEALSWRLNVLLDQLNSLKISIAAFQKLRALRSFDIQKSQLAAEHATCLLKSQSTSCCFWLKQKKNLNFYYRIHVNLL